jgi:hypothetical protein
MKEDGREPLVPLGQRDIELGEDIWRFYQGVIGPYAPRYVKGHRAVENTWEATDNRVCIRCGALTGEYPHPMR